MGKFDEALKKAEAAKNSTVLEPVASKVVEISHEEIDTLRLDDSTAEQSKLAPDSSLTGETDPLLVALSDTQSTIAEQFKLLRAKIFCREKACRSLAIMITSAQSLDGKSVVAANLAVTIAQGINEHVLLVDCDLRQPSLHQLFGMQPCDGIREYLENGTSIAPYLQKTKVNKLTLLPAGKPPPNPSELLSSEKMRRLVEELRDRYQDRHIIFDVTPAGFAAEANFLATMMDNVLLVIRSGRTAMKPVMEAIDHIGRDRILGIVFNGDRETQKKYDYYYRYYKKK